MFEINAEVQHNYATFKSTTSSECLMVESFDNLEFDVYRGTVANMTKIGVIVAETDESLTNQLKELVK